MMPNAPLILATDSTGAPLDDCRALLQALPAYDDVLARQTAQAATQQLLNRSSNGRFLEWVVWMAGWMGAVPPASLSFGAHIFAGNNGWVTGQDAERAEQELKLRMIALSSGGSPACALAGALGAGLHLYDLASDSPSANAAIEDGMTEIACARALAFGLESVRHESDILIVKAIGIGQREVAGALAVALFGGTAADWLAGSQVEPGDSFARREAIVTQMAARIGRGKPDALEILRRSGSREIVAAIGTIIAARAQKIPVLVEGFAATLAIAVLQSLQSGTADHCSVASTDGTPGHDQLCRQLAKEPVLDLRMSGIDAVPGLAAGQLLRTAAIAHAEGSNRAALSTLSSARPNLAH
jgi:nicotinate-nucleotide--dimethylbenzimidazole phosphoribosyltransferase